MRLIFVFLFSCTFLHSAANAQYVGGGTNRYTLDPWTGVFLYSVNTIEDMDGDGVPDFLMGAPTAVEFGTTTGAGGIFSGATGLEIQHFAGLPDERFGSYPSPAGDVNGDGIEDVMFGAINSDDGALQSVGGVYVFSGADGSVIHSYFGKDEYDTFASALEPMGDLDGDGYDDFLIGSSRYDSAPGSSGRGRVWAYSGATGLVIYSLPSGSAGSQFGKSLANLGDVDSDGVNDFIVGEPGRGLGPDFGVGRVSVFSGATGSLIYFLNGVGSYNAMGSSVEALGDLNGDGVEEYIARHTDARPIGEVRSGIDGSILYTYEYEFFEEFSRGRDARGGAVGDINGDGTPDFFFADMMADPNPLEVLNAGSVWIYSGATGARLARFAGTERSQAFGTEVSPIGDIDGDGYDEFCFGGWTASVLGMDSFLQASVPVAQVSTATTVNCELDFPVAASSMNYRVLFTHAGMVSQDFGTSIPLSLSGYLLDSWQGNYPFASHTGMSGILDSSGDSTASFALPILPSLLVGRSFWLAAVAFPAGQLPAFSTGVAEVRFVP